MEQKSLDLILTDTECTEYPFFIYVLPEDYMDCKDAINLYIFLHDESYEEQIPDYYAEVWARVGFEPQVIWQIDTLSIPMEDFDARGFPAILDQINVSEDFRPNLRKLIEMVERAKQSGHTSRGGLDQTYMETENAKAFDKNP